jgi:two-component system chemotaxis response regulator CheB
MPEIHLVVIGGSAGALRALIDIVDGLPASMPAAVLAVLHTKTGSDSYLPEILGRHSTVPVEFAASGKTIRPGHVYVAPPDVHLLVDHGRMRLNRGPRENGFRPAVDPLFRSAARAYGERVMGIILSGALDDGTYGLQVIKQSGGTTVVQQPGDAAFPSMPLNALRYVGADHVVPAAAMASLIASAARAALDEGDATMARTKEPEPQDPQTETDVHEMEHTFGPASGLTCPDCGGALWRVRNGELTRYRCHVGHRYTTEGLDLEQQEMVENALWTAVRVLEEHAELRERMATRADAAGMALVSSGFSDSARASQQQAHTIRELLFHRAMPAPEPQPLETAASAKRSVNGRGKTVSGKGRKGRRRTR